jgi:hypothetical protein
MRKNEFKRPQDMSEVVGWVYDYWVSKHCQDSPPLVDCIDLSEIDRLNPVASNNLSIVPLRRNDFDSGLFGEPRASFQEVCKSGHLWHRKGWADTSRDGEPALQETLALPVLGDDRIIGSVVMVTADLPAPEASADAAGCFVRWLSPIPPNNA